MLVWTFITNDLPMDKFDAVNNERVYRQLRTDMYTSGTDEERREKDLIGNQTFRNKRYQFQTRISDRGNKGNTIWSSLVDTKRVWEGSRHRRVCSGKVECSNVRV